MVAISQLDVLQEALGGLRMNHVYDLSSAHGLTSDQLHETADAAMKRPRLRDRYAQSSADLVMRGGTTSGVVYPLAICKIARRYRLRSIGGSSAGAIAAALAAAAELGRQRQDLGVITPGDHTIPPEGRVRPGFLGLTDLVAWLTGVDGTEKDEYRLAGLFRPAGKMRRLFRLAAAYLRNPWRLLLLLPILLPAASGIWISLLATAVVALSVTLLATPLERTDTTNVLQAFGISLLAMAAVAAVLIGAAFLIFAFAKGQNLGARIRRALFGLLFWLAAVLLFLVDYRASPTLKESEAFYLWFAALPAVALAASGCGALHFYALYGQLSRARKNRYGLISGGNKRPAWPGRALDRLAGMPAQDAALAWWLSDRLDELAGQSPGECLRFGHLWLKDYTPRDFPDYMEELAGLSPADRAMYDRYQGASEDAAKRGINLELMSSEISHGLAYRFPLSHATRNHRPGALELSHSSFMHESLYICRADLATAGSEIFPPRIIDALFEGGLDPDTHAAVVNGEKEETIKVHRLPDPWNMPVIFAVRMSLSLPILFQAVPMYRRVGDSTGPIKVERLWFSDGGLTSNFPIHFFDSTVPPWPTLGINLAKQTDEYPEDVYMPTILEASSRPQEVGDSLLAFFTSCFATSRNWRDNMNTLLPGFGSRVATIRLGKSEGDTKLFMRREILASLALRGARAGELLLNRFDDREPTGYWAQHQAVRLQTSGLSLAAYIRDLGESHGVGLAKRVRGRCRPQAAAKALTAGGNYQLRDVRGDDIAVFWRLLLRSTSCLAKGRRVSRLIKTWRRHGMTEVRQSPRA